MKKSKTVMVTGGAGFIGSGIVRRLLKDGYNVKIVDNLSTGNIRNIQDVDILSEVEFLAGNILDLPFLTSVFKGVDYILHEAAIPSVPRSINDPIASHQANVDGTFNVLMASHQANVQKVVLASSSSIYGDRVTGKAGKNEDMRPQPLSPYATNKIIGEQYAKIFSHIYGLPTVCLRYFNVFGPRQDPNSEYSAVIPKFIKAILIGKQPIIYGDGKQTRDFTYIDNVVEANILAMKSKKVAMGESINVACGNSISLLQLVRDINKILGTAIKPKFGISRAGEVRDSKADITKAKKLLGYVPEVTFKEGLEKTIEKMKEVYI